MILTLNMKDGLDIGLFPDTEHTDILQNIWCILTTVKGTCPNLRDYGMDPEILHLPLPVAKGAYAVCLQKQFELYEPRATLKSLTFDTDKDHPGTLYPSLEVIIP